MTYKIRVRLFLLDDDETIHYVVKDALKHSDVDDLEVFETEEEFFAKFDSTVNIAIIDDRLGGQLTGLQVMKNLKLFNPACKVILISGTKSFEMLMEYLEQGVSKYYYKNDPGFLGKLMVGVNKLAHELKTDHEYWEMIRSKVESISLYGDSKNKLA